MQPDGLSVLPSDRCLPDGRALIMTHPDRYRSIFEALRAKLNAETLQRLKRPVDVWILAERKCVHAEINRLRALLLDYPPVSLATVERAERLAVGHSDYISKYAHAATDLVLREEAP